MPIAIVGASARAAATSAVRAGFQPVTADLFAYADLREIASTTLISPYPAGLVDWLRAVEPPAWMYTGDLENHPELIDQMAWIAPLWGISGEVLAEVRDPLLIAATLREAGHRFSDTRLPVVQQRINGVSCSAVFVANEGSAALVGVARQLTDVPWLGANEFQYAGTLAPCTISKHVRNEIESIGNVLAARFCLVGVFCVDLILRDDEVWTLEVIPRYMASMEVLEQAMGVSVVAAHAAACCGTSMDLLSVRKAVTSFHGKAIVFADRPVTIDEPFFAWALGESRRKPWPNLADISPAGTTIAPGQPIATVFAEGSDAGEVELRLQARVKAFEDRLNGV